MSDEEFTTDELPRSDFFGKAIDVMASIDNLMVTLYSALIGGVVLLLLSKNVSPWVGAPLVLALASFVTGIGHTLLHMSFVAKLLLLAEGIRNGTKLVPNALEQSELTSQAYQRSQAWAQAAFASQLIYMLVGVSFGGLAVLIHLWTYMWRGAVIGVAIIAILFLVGSIIAIWKGTLKTYPSSLKANHKK